MITSWLHEPCCGLMLAGSPLANAQSGTPSLMMLRGWQAKRILYRCWQLGGAFFDISPWSPLTRSTIIDPYHGLSQYRAAY